MACVGLRKELDFADEARSCPGIWVGVKLLRHGDYLMVFGDACGSVLELSTVVDIDVLQGRLESLS